jgi:hypothetical protein
VQGADTSTKYYELRRDIMKRIITIFTLITFVIYIGGCSKSVKLDILELKLSEKYKKTDVKKIEFESATLLNEETLKFNKKSGRLDLEQNMISGMLNTGDSTFIGLDTVRHLNHRKFSYFKTCMLVLIILSPIIIVAAGSESMNFSIGQ